MPTNDQERIREWVAACPVDAFRALGGVEWTQPLIAWDEKGHAQRWWDIRLRVGPTTDEVRGEHIMAVSEMLHATD